jgi:hypothetical protein
MSLRKDWLSRQFVRVDADVRNWPISMKVEAGFATSERAGQRLSSTSDEKAAIAPKEPAKKSD